jgi:YjbE family integral membrane protein
MTQAIVGTLAAIILVDLALSGDNAFVIGAVASKVPRPQRQAAILLGGAIAIVLRIVLTSIAVLILQFPFLQAIGAVIVFAIAVQIINSDDPSEEEQRVKRLGDRPRLRNAIIAIFIADVSMSIDNVLAIAALAHGNYLLLAIGLLFSIGLLLVASSIVARLIERFPWMLYIAGGILAWTAGNMFAEDSGLHPFIATLDKQIPGPPLPALISPVVLAVFLIIASIIFFVHRRQHASTSAGS